MQWLIHTIHTNPITYYVSQSTHISNKINCCGGYLIKLFKIHEIQYTSGKIVFFSVQIQFSYSYAIGYTVLEFNTT